MKKYKLFYSILAVVLVGALAVAGTLAYLTDTDNATNTFTVGNVDIELSEPLWDGYMQEAVDHSKIIPGKTIIKDPTVTLLEGSEPAYIRVKVTIPAALKAIMEDLELNTGWVLSNTDDEDYYFEFTGIVTPDTTLLPVFDEVVIKGPGVSNEDLAALENDDLQITILAQAIQSANFANQAEAWIAFELE